MLQYYNDFVLAFDTMEKKWSRVGVLPCQPNNRHLQLSILVMACVCVCCADGCITSHCGTNGTHVICIGGEPRHGKPPRYRRHLGCILAIWVAFF